MCAISSLKSSRSLSHLLMSSCLYCAAVFLSQNALTLFGYWSDTFVVVVVELLS